MGLIVVADLMWLVACFQVLAWLYHCYLVQYQVLHLRVEAGPTRELLLVLGCYRDGLAILALGHRL